MEEKIENRMTMESVIMLNKLDRPSMNRLLEEMKDFYITYEYYMTASKLHCVVNNPEYTMEYCSQMAARLFHPLLESVLKMIYNEQYDCE